MVPFPPRYVKVMSFLFIAGLLHSGTVRLLKVNLACHPVNFELIQCSFVSSQKLDSSKYSFLS